MYINEFYRFFGSSSLSARRQLTVAVLAVPMTMAFQSAVIAQQPYRLAVTVNAAVSGSKFQAYVGGGSNISPPDSIGGGGGIPLISISNGSAFMAGEISVSSPKAEIVKVTFTVANPSQNPVDFKIGDVKLRTAKTTWDDFMAVGYGGKLCAMDDEDRKKVKQTTISLRPGERSRLSIAFPMDAGTKSGDLLLPGASPAHFEISGATER